MAYGLHLVALESWPLPKIIGWQIFCGKKSYAKRRLPTSLHRDRSDAVRDRTSALARETRPSLWNNIQSAYRIDDKGGIELLALACQTLDRVESLSEEITRDGPVYRDGEHPPKAHAALRDELQGRALVAKLLEKLGVTTVAPDTPSGRPRKHWRGTYD